MVPTRSLFPGKVFSLKHECPGPGKVLTFEYLRLKSGKSPCFQSLCQNSNDQHHLTLVVFFPSGDNDVKLFGNPSDPLTNHRCRVVWRHLVPAKIPCVSFIKFYYVVAESQSAHALCHVAIVCSLIGPQSRWYTWCTLCKPSSIVLAIRQHNQDWIPQMNGVRKLHFKESGDINKETKTHCRCKKIPVWYPASITTCHCVADRRGTSHFRAMDLDQESLFG